MPDPSSIQPALGLASAALSILAFLPYLRAVATGRARPHRGCWLVWAVVCSVSLAAMWADLPPANLAFVGAQVGGTVAVAALAAIRGVGPMLRRRDLPMLGGAAAGLTLWAATDEPGLALAATIGTCLVAGCGTVAQAWRHPERETPATWLLFLAAALLALAAVPAPEPLLLAYPLYLVTLYGAVAVALLRPRRRATWLGLALDDQPQR